MTAQVRMIKLACVLSNLILFSERAVAQSSSEVDTGRCADALVAHVGKHFAIANFSYALESANRSGASAATGGAIAAGVCKTWPTNNARTIAAFAYDGGTQDEKKLLVAIVEGAPHRVVASYKSAISEDAATEVSSDSLRLDTAPYTLSKRTRAFALRLNTLRERCAYDGGYSDELTLFVVDGQAIRPVLTETMSQWRYGEGNRCGGAEVLRVEANVTIAVESRASNGLADLRLSAVRSDNKKRFSAVVKYDGRQYDLTPWSVPFAAWRD